MVTAVKKPAEKKTISEAKNPETQVEAKAPSKKATVHEIETNAQSASDYLAEIGIKLSDEQVKQVNGHLRVRTARAGKSYVRTDVEFPANLGPQKKVILAVLSTNDALTTAQWAEACEGKLETRQDPKRVINFYKPELMALGLIKAV